MLSEELGNFLFFYWVFSPFSTLFIALCTPRHPVYTRDKKEGGEQQLAIIYFRAKSLPSLTHGDSWTLCHTTLKNLDWFLENQDNIEFLCPLWLCRTTFLHFLPCHVSNISKLHVSRPWKCLFIAGYVSHIKSKVGIIFFPSNQIKEFSTIDDTPFLQALTFTWKPIILYIILYYVYPAQKSRYLNFLAIGRRDCSDVWIFSFGLFPFGLSDLQVN